MSGLKFGTDGVRGRFGEDVDATLAWWVGYACARALGGPLAVGRDTRPSSPALASAALAGARAGGAAVVDYGVLPTPALAWAVRERGARGGIMITASHNLADDNGLKVLGPGGEKADEALRSAIEGWLGRSRVPPELYPRGDATRGTIVDWRPLATLDLHGVHVVFDSANGAAHLLGPTLLRAAGAQVTTLGDGDGRKINRHCGATHPEALLSAVESAGADVGIALDGDGDRLAMVVHRAVGNAGGALDGDAMLWILAQDLEPGATVVGTVMSNLALEQGITARGGRFERAAVGDAEVWARMEATGAPMGGEPSGHIMFRGEGAPVGSCGLSTAARVLSVGQPALRERLGRWKPAFQRHGMVPVTQASAAIRRVEGSARKLAVTAQVATVAGALAGEGARVVVRPSGTEPIIRAMVEHADAAVAEAGLLRLMAALSDDTTGDENIGSTP